MRHLLILNPNTDTTLTRQLVSRAAPLLPSGHTVGHITATFGARYIACSASLVIAAHATLDAFARFCEKSPFLVSPSTTVLIACFGDPGLAALQDITHCAVTGMAQASLQACRQKGGRTGIITGGSAWQPLIENLVLLAGFSADIAGIRTISVSGEHASKNPAATHQALLEAARSLIVHNHADRILLAGAGLAGMDAALAATLPVPVHCSFTESIKHIVQAQPDFSSHKVSSVMTSGLSQPLTALLKHPR
ncbi:hypothetical protein CSR02_05215 [Acetobacter pomorum]|uniref:Asp/Glu racemase n=1 Tax=Acetobacter pomorum TaxID=65959 RepID=A0A2G4RDG1_9PROT|nr:aspartate/glutamate racemase family protein [Acetobacter pomorum]PHY94613.1 hypothetical protein CSR02_05215 [Acetobacter pomorum]